MEVPREAKNRTATGSRHPTPGHISRQNSKRQACSSAALFRRGNTWKQSKCPQTEEWLEQKWYMNTEDKIMSPEATRMQLETIRLSEVSQKRKTNALWYYFRARSASAHGLLTAHVLSRSSCLTLRPGSSVPGISQVRMLEWVALSYSREYS